ncbi:putative tRNA-dihydrouridine(16/17) synthase (NAD(P)(+)) [Helianthus annuus]|nr:putative tRNA-dihydrouridine(16/17) synthase (NAD(P)(+)) [Helianthus annuus]
MTSTNSLSNFMIHNHSYTSYGLRCLSTASPPYHGGGGGCGMLSRSYTCNYVTDEQPLSSNERAWAHWRKIKQPKLIVAPMYDGSELPFRMLCRKYGAEAAYTPMLHSRSFAESKKFRLREFSTCEVRNRFS